VFTRHIQRISSNDPAQEADWLCLHQRFEDLKILHQQKKQDRCLRRAERSEDGWTPRHQRNQQYNRYRTIDLPARDDMVKPNHARPRYAIKERGQPIKRQDQPKALKQYTLKPMTPAQEKKWKEAQAKDRKRQANKKENKESLSESKKKEAKKKTKKEKSKRAAKKAGRKKVDVSIEDMTKAELVRSLAHEHPLTTLTVGTLSANTKRAEEARSGCQREVQACIEDITRQAQWVKRDVQSFIGMYIEAAFDAELIEEDKSILSTLCPQVKSAIVEGDGIQVDDGDEDVMEVDDKDKDKMEVDEVK
ncbi:hypothetical protein BGW41_008066, partial [Actinomortierella wolfii]